MATVTLTFHFHADMPHERVGTQLEVTKPDNSVEYIDVPEDDLSTDSVLFDYQTFNPHNGDKWTFKIRTICERDEYENPISVSNFAVDTATYTHTL